MKRSPLKRGNKPLRRYTPLRPRRPGKRSEPGSSSYMNWIRSLPCAICGSEKRSEPAHTHQLGHKPYGAKTSCRSCIPLCAWCHRLDDDCYHRLSPEDRWADYHNLDLPYLVDRLNRAYDLMRSTLGLRRAA